ncbi:unnamed protein product, partial [Mesorhabditis spiculigera]
MWLKLLYGCTLWVLGLTLSSWVDNYEPLNYAPISNARRKRSIGGYGQRIRVNINSYNRTFRISLLPVDASSSPFGDEHYADQDGQWADIDPASFLYEGFLEGDEKSRVYGSILDGIFDGHIHTGDGHSFSVDKAAKYFDMDSRPKHYHSIIYHDDEINHGKMRVKRAVTNDKDDSSTHGCALDEPRRREMDRVQRSAETHQEWRDSPFATIGALLPDVLADRRNMWLKLLYGCTLCVLGLTLSSWVDNYEPLKRQAKEYAIPRRLRLPRTKTTSSQPRINTRICKMVLLLIDVCHGSTQLFVSADRRMTVGALLEYLVHEYPTRVPSGGTLFFYEEEMRPHMELRHYSRAKNINLRLEHAIVISVSQLTLAHEIGHNFGSPHDFPAECQPGLPLGNFIMFASATSGDKPNNAKFSSCSINNISSVLNVVLASVPIDPTKYSGPVGPLTKRNCFQERTSAFCGNQIHEPGEECDCGFSQADCDQMADRCCYPHEGRLSGLGTPCKRKKGAMCSPSEGFCCNGERCSLFGRNDFRVCRQESECSEAQTCDGLSAQCPQSRPKANGLACQDSTKVCSGGSCNGSVCEAVGLRDCFLTEGKPEELCYLACLKDGKCLSSVLLPEFSSQRLQFLQSGRKGQSGLVLHPGSPCNNYKGYCDILRKCRSVDANGPLARLKNLLFNKRTFDSVQQWVQEIWWIVVLVFLVLMVLYMKFYAAHIPSFMNIKKLQPVHAWLLTIKFFVVIPCDENSRVYGSILDGIFDGHIHTGDGHSFSVDKAAKYFDMDSRPKHYHSIIYHDDEINHGKMRVKRAATNDKDDSSTHGCALDEPRRREMDRVQRSAETHQEWRDSPFATMRTKRSVRKEDNGLYNVRTCSLYLQADHKLYEHILMKEGNKDPIRTREEIVSLFYNHIKAVNEIYEGTDFNGIRGLHFVIQRTSIYTPDSCSGGRAKDGADNPFCEDNVDVSNFLNLNSQKNHSAFCLAYALTFRDFVGGTLGLAWVASPQINTAGGVCQVYQRYNEGPRGWIFRSLNTGIVTLVNYGNRVPARVSQLTLAHEIGHNFGSPHDFPAECQPGLPLGNFIMFASATSGDKPNNAKFSSCSINNISSVLNVVLASVPIDPTKYSGPVGPLTKRNCFQERTSAFCGNQIHEPGEECDCGFSQADCDQMADRCCYPHEGRLSGLGTPCKRKKGAMCSPSEGFCCNGESCSLFGRNDFRVCRQESECSEAQTCDGLSAQCPQSRPKANGLACQDSTKVCSGGSCNGSVCEAVGLRDCFLTEGKPEELCYLACLKDGKCLSSVLLPEFSSQRLQFLQSGRKGQSGLVLHPGSPCNNYKGYCDILRKCRSVDANGPLARLKNLLFNKRTFDSVQQWVQESWWIVVLGGLGFLVLMALFVKCCAVHTPSTNPNKPPPLNIYQTLTRPSTLIRQRRQQRQPPSGGVRQPTGGGVGAGHGGGGGGGVNSRAAPSVIVVEPPPPYTAAADPGSALGGPPRGHRKNKRQTAADAKPQQPAKKGQKPTKPPGQR